MENINKKDDFIYITEEQACFLHLFSMYRECMKGKTWEQFLDWIDCCNSKILNLLLYKYKASLNKLFSLLCKEKVINDWKTTALQDPSADSNILLSKEKWDSILELFK